MQVLGPTVGVFAPQTINTTEEELQDIFGTNLFATVAVTRSLLPLLKKSDAGRIVNLSSILGSLALQADPNSPVSGFKPFAYNASKAALNAFTIHLAAELKDTRIKVNSAHPGWVKTEMGTDQAPMEIPDGAKTSVDLALLGPTVPAAASSTKARNYPGNPTKGKIEGCPSLLRCAPACRGACRREMKCHPVCPGLPWDRSVAKWTCPACPGLPWGVPWRDLLFSPRRILSRPQEMKCHPALPRLPCGLP